MYVLYTATALLGDTSSSPTLAQLRRELVPERKAEWIRCFLTQGGFRWAVSVSFLR